MWFYQEVEKEKIIQEFLEDIGHKTLKKFHFYLDNTGYREMRFTTLDAEGKSHNWHIFCTPKRRVIAEINGRYAQDELLDCATYFILCLKDKELMDSWVKPDETAEVFSVDN